MQEQKNRVVLQEQRMEEELREIEKTLRFGVLDPLQYMELRARLNEISGAVTDPRLRMTADRLRGDLFVHQYMDIMRYEEMRKSQARPAWFRSNYVWFDG